jgi:tetratricopeptide (TPR) repeat protein
VAQKIAEAVQAVVTPAEQKQLNKKPTENLLAYDYYLQGIDRLYSRTQEGLEATIPLLQKAIDEDPQFSLAYAQAAIAYYFLDEYKKEKQYTEEINTYADKALLYDSQLAESLIAKALYYTQIGEYRLALPHLEKALEYNPNSGVVIQILADYYSRVTPNTEKYLEYALKGIQLRIGATDSVAQSYMYLHLSNALAQSGFVEEALVNIDRSLSYDANNYYAPIVKAFILYAQNRDLTQTRELLKAELAKDSTRLDILQEVGKMYYFQQDYKGAYDYYKKFVTAREKYGLKIYVQEDSKIGWVYEKMGFTAEAENFYETYAAYCEQDESIYKEACMTVRYTQEGDRETALEQLRLFAEKDNIQYWVLLFLEKDPALAPLKTHPEFAIVVQKIKDRFWKNQARLKKTLEEKGLI